MSSRLFDKSNYLPKTIETYEILSAYYVDIFYNHLYTEAKKLRAQSSVGSVTEGYKHTLTAFLKGLNNPKLYKKSLIGIHHYFMNIGIVSITFTKCVNRITSEFVPTDYFSSLSSTQKMGVLRKVISQSIRRFIRKIVDEHMAMIIDNHKDRDNVRILQDVLIDCFIWEREGMYQLFIEKQTTSKSNGVDVRIAEKMQAEIKKLVKEKYEQKKQISLLTKLCHGQKQKIHHFQRINEHLRKQIQSVNTQLEESRHEKKALVSTANSTFINRSQESMFKNSPPATHMRASESRFFTDVSQQDRYSKRSVFDGIKNEQAAEQTADLVENVVSTHVDEPREETNIPELKLPTPNASGTNDESDDSLCISDDDGQFIEVNDGNIRNIVHGDNEYLQHIKDTRVFNDKMDTGTTLDDFS